MRHKIKQGIVIDSQIIQNRENISNNKTINKSWKYPLVINVRSIYELRVKLYAYASSICVRFAFIFQITQQLSYICDVIKSGVKCVFFFEYLIIVYHLVMITNEK